MIASDVAILLAYAAQLDPVMLPAGDEEALIAKATVWSDTLHPTMTLEYAQTIVRSHYGSSVKGSITPALLNMAWGQRPTSIQTLPSGDFASSPHCGRRDCPCTHTSGCFKGWLDEPVLDAAGDPIKRERDTTRPCPTCRPTTVERLTNRYTA